MLGEERFSKEIGVIQDKWLRINKKTIENLIGIFYVELGTEEKAIPELSQEQQKQFTEEIVKLFIGRKFYKVKEELPDQEIDRNFDFPFNFWIIFRVPVYIKRNLTVYCLPIFTY